MEASSNDIGEGDKKDLKSALQNIKLKQKLGKIVNKTAVRRYQLLEQVNFKMLNDLSMMEVGEAMLKQQKNQEEGHQILTRLGALFPPFNPSSRFKLIWDLLQMAFNIFLLFIFPIHLVFEMSLYSLVPYFAIKTLIPIGLILDIVVNLNTACFLKGVLTLNRGIIFSNYLQHNLKYDLIANLPLLIYCFSYNDEQTGIGYNFIRFSILSYFYKVAQHNQVFKKLEDVFPLSTYSSNIISLIKLLFSIILNLHISALVWLFLAFSEIKNGCDSTWMHAAFIDTAGWSTQYIYSYYFSTVTMITVGYGDISPRTVAEKLVSVVNMMIACGQFAYSVNSIGNIFSQFFKLSNEIKANIYIINNYMTTKNIRKDLQYQVREYLEYYWKEEKSSNTELELKILNQLSQKLKDTLLMEANKIALRDSPIFSQNFSESIIQKTLPLIKEFRCTPEETIYLKGDQDDSSIYFIEKGCVEAFTYQRSPLNKKMKTINPLFTLGTGSFFGSFNFFTGQSREINMRSLEFTTLLKVKRSDFLSLLKDYPDDYEVFCMIRDQVMYSDQMQSIGVKCECCSKSDHLLHLCPLIHFVPQKFPIIRNFSHGKYQPRQSIYKDQTTLSKRIQKINRYHSLTKSAYLQQRLTDFKENKFEELKIFFRATGIDNDKEEYDSDNDTDEDFSQTEEEYSNTDLNSQLCSKPSSLIHSSRNFLPGSSQKDIQLNLMNQNRISGSNHLIPREELSSILKNSKQLVAPEIDYINEQRLKSDKRLSIIIKEPTQNGQLLDSSEAKRSKIQTSLLNLLAPGEEDTKDRVISSNELSKISKKDDSMLISLASMRKNFFNFKQIIGQLQIAQEFISKSIRDSHQNTSNQIEENNSKYSSDVNSQKAGNYNPQQHHILRKQSSQITNPNQNQQQHIPLLNFPTQRRAHFSFSKTNNEYLDQGDYLNNFEKEQTLAKRDRKSFPYYLIKKEAVDKLEIHPSLEAIQPLKDKDMIDDTHRIYKFFYPQHNLSHILEKLAESVRLKQKKQKLLNINSKKNYSHNQSMRNSLQNSTAFDGRKTKNNSKKQRYSNNNNNPAQQNHQKMSISIRGEKNDPKLTNMSSSSCISDQKMPASPHNMFLKKGLSPQFGTKQSLVSNESCLSFFQEGVMCKENIEESKQTEQNLGIHYYISQLITNQSPSPTNALDDQSQHQMLYSPKKTLSQYLNADENKFDN